MLLSLGSESGIEMKQEHYEIVKESLMNLEKKRL